MKLLFSSDLHGFEPAFAAFAHTLATGPYEAGVLAGDLLDEWLPPEQVEGLLADDPFVEEAPAARLTQALHRRRQELQAILEAAEKPVFFVLGNHDVTPWPDSPFLTNLHGKVIAWSGLTLAGYRWTRMDRYPHELEEDVSTLKDLVGPQTILVTHSPPWGVLDALPGARFRYGLKTLHQIPQPQMHLFGHVHECAGVQGHWVNGAWPLSRRFFSIDTETKDVRVADTPPSMLP